MDRIPSVMPNHTHNPSLPSSSDQQRRSLPSSSQIARSHISSIAVLPSSLPEYHKAYMKGHPKKGPLPAFEETPPNEKRTDDQRADTRRSLRPNFRAAAEIARARPEPMTSIPAKKSRPTKWQFGIRSRNQPAEAMLAIYKALRAMGADWEVPRTRKPGGGSGSRSRSGSAEGRSHSRSRSRSNSRGSSISSHSSRDEYSTSRRNSDRSISPGHREPLSVRNSSPNGSPGRERGRSKKHYSSSNDWGYSIPEDPWVINARFRKDGMFPPGVAHPSSTHSSRVNLNDDPAGLRRRSSTNTSHSSVNHVEGITTTGSTAGDSNSSRFASADEAVYIYMSIQLYSIERDFFVVDFKCAGYERLVNNVVREVKASNTDISTLKLSPSQSREYEDGWDDEQGVWRRLGDGEEMVDGAKAVLRERTEEVGAGRSTGEKRATSPFPFLDVASSLILQLSGE